MRRVDDHARMIQLRRLEQADLANVLRIQDACYSEIVPETGQSLAAKILASPSTCFLAETAAGVIGYLVAVPVLYPDLPALNDAMFRLASDSDTLYIHDLAVTDAGRGTGAGRALVRAALDAATAQGLGSACLVAIQGSQRFWAQHGFETVASPPDRVAAKLASYGAAAQLMRATLRVMPSGLGASRRRTGVRET